MKQTVLWLAFGLSALSSTAFAQSYDGDWLVKIVGGTGCKIKSGNWVISITGKKVTSNGMTGIPRKGTVGTNGKLRISGLADTGNRRIVVMNGQLDGVQGNGRYFTVGGQCRGTFTAVKQ